MHPDSKDVFDIEYRKIKEDAAEYIIVDKDKSADIQINLNDDAAARALMLPQCDTVLCMETLEHLRNPGVICDKISELVRNGATAYITVPRPSLGSIYYEKYGVDLRAFSLGKWDPCSHLYGFYKHHLDMFLEYNFPGLTTSIHSCLGHYSWIWPIIWLATQGRGMSWGVIITNNNAAERAR